DSICSTDIPKLITGTLPVGGSGTYSYKWQKSYDLAAAPSLIGGATSKDYTPAAAEADTFWIRRIVKDEGTSLTDTSKWVQINVTPAITGNLVGKDTTICYGQNPLILGPLNTGPSNGNGWYQYQWLQNLDNLNWPTSANATGTSNSASYDPPSLTSTTYYQRKITSGRCVNYSSSVKITVLPSITGNTMLSADTVICEGTIFNKLRASAPVNGQTGNYDYQWQDSVTSVIFQSTAVADIAATYVPDTSKFAVKEQIYFRRVVYSGPDSVCVSKTAPVLLTRWHKIKSNTISADQTICSGDTPANLTGAQPTQGDHINYQYQWQDSSKTATWTTLSTVTANSPYVPPALTDTTWYRRIVTSSKCTNTSNKIIIKVHDPITNNITEADTTICNGANPKKLRGKLPVGGNGIFAYQWYSSTDNFSSNNVSISASGTLKNYDPPALSTTTSYRREVISGACKTFSNASKITVLPSITANTITPDKPEVCFNTLPNPITGSPLTGGAGGSPTWIWQDSISGSPWAIIPGAASQNYTHTVSLVKQKWYRRIIRSGPFDCCIDTSAVAVIDTVKLPAATVTSVTDTTICNGSEVKLKVTLSGAKNWNLVYNENSTPVTVNNISSGKYTISRVPSAGSAMQTFIYSLSSLIDANGCSAVPAGLNGTRKANVYRVPVTNAGPDDEICGPVYTLRAVPSDGTGTWTFPSALLSGNTSLYNATVAIDSSFTTASVSHKFYWAELNGICASKDSVTITFDNRIDPVDAGTGEDIMSFDNATMVNATDLMPFETGLWSVETGSGDFEFPDKDSTYITGLSIGTNTFKWTVTNGRCTLNDLITFVVSKPVIPELISPNNDAINDTLIITGLDFVTQTIELTILNGAGTLVFSTSNKEGNSEWVNWDGKNSKGVELPEGTYYYLLKVTSGKVAGNVSRKSGFIILKRQ
ncbi:MAG: gliding motility-associated C-terminal domain-containing protein, partial [Bacteroidales bacterium]|nr:gliding motility-associated C-terminal domain-containing protein [Bacteroidales bacterium]